MDGIGDNANVHKENGSVLSYLRHNGRGLLVSTGQPQYIPISRNRPTFIDSAQGFSHSFIDWFDSIVNYRANDYGLDHNFESASFA